MAGRVLLMIVVPLGLLGLLVYTLRGWTAAQLDGPARSARRRAAATSALAVLGALAFVLLAPSDEVGLATMPALAAAAGVVIAALAELTWPRPHGERREASVTVRRGTGATTLTRLLLAAFALAVVLLIAGSVTAGPGGRSVERSWATGAAGAGPYPGTAYAVPMAVALAVLALATWWGLRRADARPALGSGLEDVDRAVRVGAKVRVLRLAAAGVLLTDAGLALSMSLSLIRLAHGVRANWTDAPSPPWDWTQNAGLALLVLGVACLVVAAVALLWRSPQIPRAQGRDIRVADVAQL